MLKIVSPCRSWFVSFKLKMKRNSRCLKTKWPWNDNNNQWSGMRGERNVQSEKGRKGGGAVNRFTTQSQLSEFLNIALGIIYQILHVCLSTVTFVAPVYGKSIQKATLALPGSISVAALLSQLLVRWTRLVCRATLSFSRLISSLVSNTQWVLRGKETLF